MSGEEPLRIPETIRLELARGLVEEMPLEDYLKGVVPTEMGLQKPIEALKAQAIAARSYAISTRRHAAQGFDVCATGHCQVYKPRNRYAEADRAVRETAGQVITYRGRIVGAPFFGHCDGHTRNSEDVWPSAVAYLRSVPCICGYDKLYGHGVGMCQRGAATMARQGASAEEILEHYYSGTEVAEGLYVPRTSFRRSIIMGQVRDGRGRPVPALALFLSGPEGTFKRRTNANGKFWISGLPAGTWKLQFRDQPVTYKNLVTDGRNTIVLRRVMIPGSIPLVVSTVPLAYPPQLAGTLGYEGVPVTIVDPEGNQQQVLSGSAREFNPGGFAMPLRREGRYTVHVLDQEFGIDVGGTSRGMWVRFGHQEE